MVILKAHWSSPRFPQPGFSLSSYFSSWWCRPIWKICLSSCPILDHLPGVSKKQKKRNHHLEHDFPTKYPSQLFNGEAYWHQKQYFSRWKSSPKLHVKICTQFFSLWIHISRIWFVPCVGRETRRITCSDTPTWPKNNRRRYFQTKLHQVVFYFCNPIWKNMSSQNFGIMNSQVIRGKKWQWRSE